MSILASEVRIPDAVDVTVTADTLAVELSDGRTIAVPIDWFPRLSFGSEDERQRWRIIGNGQGIHWEDLDEDISVEGLLAGRPSAESQASIRKWLTERS